jgi:hypothetical protein
MSQSDGGLMLKAPSILGLGLEGERRDQPQIKMT